MLAFERRWIHEILSSFAPEGGPELAPGPGAIDYVGTFAGLARSARPVARVGLRVALWLVALAPLWLGRRVCTLGSLELAARQALLMRLLEHRRYAVREAALLLKLSACLALFADAHVRARSGYDGKDPALVPLKTGARP